MKMMKKIRLERGLTLAELSELAKVSQGTIQRYVTMSEESLNRIASVLKCKPDTLKKDIYIQEQRVMACNNQRCLLNKNCYCQSDQVANGKASCMNRCLVTSSKERLRELSSDELKMHFMFPA